MNNKPIKKISAGNIQASIWKNQTQINGAVKDFFSVSLERSYKDKQGNWKNTSSLNEADIPKAQLLLSEAYRFLAMRNNEQKQAQAPPVAQPQVNPATNQEQGLPEARSF